MKLSNFKLIKTEGTNPTDWRYYASIDVETRGIMFWRKHIETKKIIRKFACFWHFVDTGKYTPMYEVENLARAWTAQTGEPT